MQNTGSINNNIVHLTHSKGIDVNLAVVFDMAGSELKIVGARDSVCVPSKDSYYCFKKQLDEIRKEIDEL